MVMKRFWLLALSFALVAHLWAQDFEVSPVLLNFNAEPGEIQTVELNVTNHSNNVTSYAFNVKDFYYNNKGVKDFLPPGSIKKSCADWLSISPSLLRVNPGETGKVNVTIQVPTQNYSTTWAAITVMPTEERDAFSAEAKMAAAISVFGKIVVEVRQSPKSNKKYKARLSNFIETTPLDTARVFKATIENIGDKILKCRVYLIATNMSTGEEYKTEPARMSSYPLSSRTIELALPSRIPPGKYALAAILDYGGMANLEGAQIMIDVD